MKTLAVSPVANVPALSVPRSRVADFVELTKPRIAVLVLFTVAAGYWLGHTGNLDVWHLFHAVFGTALVACGASALNQLLERHSDALMRRTENRPLPAGRLLPFEVLLFGLTVGLGGLAYLAWFVRQPWAVALAGFTFLSYVLIYTPLKRVTTLNTLIGAVPGALPPVIGWAAAGGGLHAEVLVLFLILFLWQVPHFLAIAWMYREDYGRAGLRMVTVGDTRGIATGRQMVGYCVALILVSLTPMALWQSGGLVYSIAAALLGGWFLWRTLQFRHAPSQKAARRVMRVSLLYLPLLLALFVYSACGFAGRG